MVAHARPPVGITSVHEIGAHVARVGWAVRRSELVGRDPAIDPGEMEERETSVVATIHVKALHLALLVQSIPPSIKTPGKCPVSAAISGRGMRGLGGGRRAQL